MLLRLQLVLYLPPSVLLVLDFGLLGCDQRLLHGLLPLLLQLFQLPLFALNLLPQLVLLLLFLFIFATLVLELDPVALLLALLFDDLLVEEGLVGGLGGGLAVGLESGGFGSGVVEKVGIFHLTIQII